VAPASQGSLWQKLLPPPADSQLKEKTRLETAAQGSGLTEWLPTAGGGNKDAREGGGRDTRAGFLRVAVSHLKHFRDFCACNGMCIET